MKAICFTGHRDIKKEEIPKIKERLHEVIKANVKNGAKYFACGGAIGFDMLAAEEVLKVKEEGENIHLVLILPFPDYTKKWPNKEKEKIKMIQEKSIYKYVADNYYKGIYFKRDRELVKGSDSCICYLSKREHSGTGYTVSRAIEKGLFITNIADDELWYEDFPNDVKGRWYLNLSEDKEKRS